MKFRGSLMFLSLVVVGSSAWGHEGPDPVAHWRFDKNSLRGNHWRALLGPDLTFTATPKVVVDEFGQSARSEFSNTGYRAKGSFQQLLPLLPDSDMTIATWVTVDQPESRGGIVGAFQDAGGVQKGWIVGYNRKVFTFGLATKGADDGDGQMTYIEGKTPYEAGRFYRVVATYDGTEMSLYVNGVLEASSKDQSGPILYPEDAVLAAGALCTTEECIPLLGRLRDVTLYDKTAKDKWVAHDFEHDQALAKLQLGATSSGELEIAVGPYLQYVTKDAITIMWETSDKASTIVRHGETIEVPTVIETAEPSTMHEVRITGLQPETQYFYKVESVDEKGVKVESEALTFQTANNPETPFAFAIISDTQDNPKVSGKIAELAWAQRPNFLLLPGDLVDKGKEYHDWTNEFFPSMYPLISRVTLFPVIGNHEQNADHYYRYMSVPDPEYYYDFTYGNTQFFVVDSNKKVDAESEQYKWLEKKLAESKATWKFVSHHHPPYSSDEDDYGDLWKTNKSTRGDVRIRELTKLYDKYNVDVVWTGHIHSYERTWPVNEGKVVEQNGTIYMIVGGGGGGLETPAPTRSFFQNNVKRGHHFCMVYINGTTLEFKAFDLQGQLFDTVILKKQSK